MIAAETNEIRLRCLLPSDCGDETIAAEAKIYGGKEGCFAVTAKDDSRVLGVVLCPKEEITVYIIKAERENGYGAAALCLGLDLLFGVLSRKKVTAVCEREPIAAVKTLLSAGMNEEKGTDGRFYGVMTVTDWELI